MYASVALVSTALLLVTPFGAGSPLGALPLPLRSSLGAQKNMDILVPDGASSVSAETINNLAIVIAETVYIMADGSVVPGPDVPGTTVVPPFPTASPPGTTAPGSGPTPILTPPPFPGGK